MRLRPISSEGNRNSSATSFVNVLMPIFLNEGALVVANLRFHICVAPMSVSAQHTQWLVDAREPEVVQAPYPSEPCHGAPRIALIGWEYKLLQQRVAATI